MPYSISVLRKVMARPSDKHFSSPAASYGEPARPNAQLDIEDANGETKKKESCPTSGIQVRI